MAVLFLVFRGASVLSSPAGARFCVPPSAHESQPLSVLTHPGHSLLSVEWPSSGWEVGLTVVLTCPPPDPFYRRNSNRNRHLYMKEWWPAVDTCVCCLQNENYLHWTVTWQGRALLPNQVQLRGCDRSLFHGPCGRMAVFCTGACLANQITTSHLVLLEGSQTPKAKRQIVVRSSGVNWGCTRGSFKET